MADNPIDINKARKNEERLTEIREYLFAIYNHVAETHNQLQMRAKDIEKDATELFQTVHVMVEDLCEKYPELVPPEFFEDEEDV